MIKLNVTCVSPYSAGQLNVLCHLEVEYNRCRRRLLLISHALTSDQRIENHLGASFLSGGAPTLLTHTPPKALNYSTELRILEE